MYRLFLCLKFLRRRYLALIAVAAVALCVAMVLIVVSVMDGFLSKAEVAGKGLWGEIVVKSPTMSGLGRYDEFIAELTGKYRIDSDYRLVSLTPKGNESLAVFEGPGQMAHAEMLAGGLDFEKPITLDAIALVYTDGQLFKQASGKLTLSEKITPPASSDTPPTRDYTLRMEVLIPSPGPGAAAGPAPASAAGLTPENLRVQSLYAVTGKGMAEIEAASPVIYTQSVMRLPPEFTASVDLCGMRLPERLRVTDLADGLFTQKGWHDATFSPPVEAMIQVSQRELEAIDLLLTRQESLPASHQDPELLQKLEVASENLPPMLQNLLLAQQMQKDVAIFERALKDEQAKPANQQDAAKIARIQEQLDKTRPVAELGKNHMIVGLGIGGLSFRTPEGTTIRLVTPGRSDVGLLMFPTGRGKGTLDLTPSWSTFTIVDDVHTDVHTVDSKTVYVPFDTLQTLLEMTERRDVIDPIIVDPARCSQINIKVRPPFDSTAQLPETARKVRQKWAAFYARHPDAASGRWPVEVATWREGLANFLGFIEKERTLVILMFGIISFVSVLLIFAIFYMIVVQKTRDIGVIRAVGGSGAGVAQIFLAFGAATGLVGAAIGLTVGWLFVAYINEIQDLLANWTGYRIWDSEFFLFAKIPNQVDPAAAVAIAAWAILSGLVGALIPSVRAAIMEPAEAIRHE